MSGGDAGCGGTTWLQGQVDLSDVRRAPDAKRPPKAVQRVCRVGRADGYSMQILPSFGHPSFLRRRWRSRRYEQEDLEVFLSQSDNPWLPVTQPIE